MTPVDRRDVATDVAAFNSARDRFLATFDHVPEEAYSYRPTGDDYALSGLLVHVACVLEHYLHVLTDLPQDGAEPPTVVDEPGAHDRVRIGRGLPRAELSAAVERIRTAHGRITTRLGGMDGETFERRVPVRYAVGAEPFPTAPADVVDWTRDHYDEHTQQIQDLLKTWASVP